MVDGGIATAFAITLSSVLYTLIRYLWGADLHTNSALLGESTTFQWAAAAFGYLLLIAGFVSLGIAAGGTARWLASRLNRSGQSSRLPA